MKMNLKAIKAALVTCIAMVMTVNALSEDPEKYAAWEARTLAEVEELKKLPPDQAIPKLGTWVLRLNIPANLEKGDRPVFQAARAALLAIPGHAEYYRDRLNELYEEKKAAAERYDMRFISLGHERGWSFSTLGHLPSPETVRVLGEMLDDMRSMDRTGIELKDWTIGNTPPAPLASGAARTLTSLGIVGAPIKTFAEVSPEDVRELTAHEYYNINVEPWRLWYAQVKSGKRAFRFEGSDVEYNLDGPVAVGSVAVATRRETEPVPAETVAPGRGTNFWPLVIALGVLGAAGGWYVVSGRKRQAS